MLKKYTALLFFATFIFWQSAKGQIIDNFSDGDFTNNPSWIGFADSFSVVSGQLRSTVGNASSLNFYLSSASTQKFDSWEFFFRLNFNPSSQNFAEFWLETDNQNIEQAQSGFFVRLGGNTGDGIGLFKKEAGTVSEIIPQSNSLVNASNNQGKIRVTRSSTGSWEIFEQISTSNFISFGTGIDNSNFATTGVGIWIKSSKTNRSRHYFDDIKVENTSAPDVTPPTLDSAKVIAGNQIELKFSEPVDEIFASTSSLFSLNPNTPISSTSRLANNFSKLLVTLASNLPVGISTITVNQAKDLAGNIQANPLQKTVLIEEQAIQRSIVINEIYADESPSLGLPAGEFVELFNNSTSAKSLLGWKLSDATTTIILPNYQIGAGEYLILCKNVDTAAFKVFGKTLGVSLPSLNNTSDIFTLSDPQDAEIDKVAYALAWYNDPSKQNGGFSLEQINPKLKCSGKFNWSASNAAIGGTPGSQNSIFSNVLDIVAPVLDSLVIVSNNQIRLVFNEILSSDLVPNTNFSIAGLSVSSVQADALNNRNLTLNLSSPIINGQTYVLSYSGIKDCEGNFVSTILTREFILVPQAPIAERALVINEIYADESPSLGLPKVEYIEILNTTNQPIQLKGASIFVGMTGILFPEFVLNANQYVTISKTDSALKFKQFGQILGIPLPTLNNTGAQLEILDFQNKSVDKLTYALSWYGSTARQNGGFSLEQMNPKLKCSSKSNWAASNAGIGGTPGTVNSIFSNLADLSAPTLDSIVVVNSNKIRLVFNEFLSNQPNPTQNISIDGLTIFQIEAGDPNERSISISLSSPIQIGQFYNLTYSGIKDCEGNANTTVFIKEFISLPAKELLSRNLVINEIYADETPSLGLPLVEYLEILNTSDKPIQLKGASLAIGGSVAVFPEYVLKSRGYVVVCKEDSAYRFLPYGNVVGVPSLTLTNSGTELKIIDIAENEIDVVNYQMSWYGSTAKQNGGFSLEQINPNLPCSAKSNWSASTAGIGGTPAAANSIISDAQDVTAPTLVKVEIIGPKQAQLLFSEPISAQSPDTSSFKIPGLEIALIGNRNPDFQSITLTFKTELEPGKKYELSLSGIKDCAGNTSSEAVLSIGKGKIPGKFDLLITEVQADISPENNLPKAEYIEIYNNSESLIDLTGTVLSDGTGEGVFPAAFIGPGEYLILTGQTSVGKFSSLSKVNVLGLSPFTTLNSEGDNLTLFNVKGAWVHQFHFRSADFSPYSKWTEGWSLEMVDLTNPCDELSNWVISNSPNGGTPGKENSLNGTKPDENAPILIRATVPDSNFIKIKWNELLDSTTLANAAISLSGGYQIVERIISPEDFSVLILKTNINLTVNQTFTIEIGLLKDCAGNATETKTIQTVRAGKADANSWILNEILFDPKTGGSDYLEMQNVSSQYLDLKEVTIASDNEEKAASSETLPIPPGGFVLFTKSKAMTLRDYPKGKAENFFEISLPTFNSDSGTVRILGPFKAEWQKFFYSDRIHAQFLDETKGVSLERISKTLPVNDQNSWHSASTDAGFGTPGYENSQATTIENGSSEFFAEPKAFSPNGDGNKDFTFLNYNFSNSGLIGNLRIYSADGFLVKTIAQSALLGKEGAWKWDGSTEQGRKARIGLYVAVLETVELGGNSKYYKLPVAIASEQ